MSGIGKMHSKTGTVYQQQLTWLEIAGSDQITPHSMMPTLPSRESSDIHLECNKTA